MKAKIIDPNKVYYICSKSEYPGEKQFVCGTVLGGRISTETNYSDVLDVYFDFIFYEESEEGSVVMKKYRNTGVFDDNDKIDYRKVNRKSMWGVNLENIQEVENPKHQALIDIITKLI